MEAKKKSTRHKWGAVAVDGRMKCERCGCFKKVANQSAVYFLPDGTKAGLFAPDCSPQPFINTEPHGSKNPLINF